MPSSKKKSSRVKDILDDFSLPDYPPGGARVTSDRAIDRFVATVLSENDEESIYSYAKKSAESRSIEIHDDASFAPVNPFDDDIDTELYRRMRFGSKIRKHWKPLSMICFGVAVVLFISAGVTKNRNIKTDGGGGTNVVGMTPAPVLETEAPTSSSITYSPTAFPTELITNEPTVPKDTPPPSASPQTAPTTDAPIVAPSPTNNPTVRPTPEPSSSPTGKPTMPEKYYEMMKAAKFVSGKDAFNRTDSAQSLAFHWLYFEGNPSSNLYEFFEQYATAVIFFSLTMSRMSSVNYALAQDDFTTRREVCGWGGVRCAFNYTSDIVHVTEIRLPAKQLKGTLPSEIGFLPYLIKLDLADNEIVGTIPEELYGLQRLRHLYLNNNKLEGIISPRIDDLNFAECE